MTAKTTEEIRDERVFHHLRAFPYRLTFAALWPKKSTNLGTLLRTADALQADIAVPLNDASKWALRKGNTIGDQVPVEWVRIDPVDWIDAYHGRVVAVELAHEATPLAKVETPTSDTVVVLGHESTGVPSEVLERVDEVVELPMFGIGNSLNVAVAGSIVGYKLRGLT